MFLGLIRQDSREKNFCNFLPVTPILLFCLSFLCICLEENKKTKKIKATALYNYDYYTSKNIFAFLWLSLFHSLTIFSCLSFSWTYLEENNKKRRLKPLSFLVKARTQAKIFFSFLSLSIFHPPSHTVVTTVPNRRRKVTVLNRTLYRYTPNVRLYHYVLECVKSYIVRS